MAHGHALRDRLDADELALGVQVTSASQAVVEVCGDLGLDFAWLDLEHTGPSPYDSTALEQYARTADAAGLELAVRLPGGEPPLLRKVLDTGIGSVVVPQVTTAAEVRAAVRATRFTYQDEPGARGSSVARSSRWGGAGEGYPAAEDARTTVGVMIETVEAVEHLEEILAVPGLDYVRLGTGDLAVSLGAPIDRDHPRVAAARGRLERLAAEHGVALCGTLRSGEDAAAMVDAGYRLLTLGKDLQVLRSVFGDRAAAIRDAVADRTD